MTAANRFRTLLLTASLLLAATACERRPDVSPAVLLTTRTLGLAYLEENQLPEAEEQFRRLTELAPDEPLGFANLGLVYLRQGNYEAAEQSIRQALDLAPRDPDIRLMLAKVLELSGRPVEAREVLDGTVAESPDHLKSWYAIAQLSYDPGDPDAAARRERALDQLTSRDPANVHARLLLIETLLENDEPDQALANLEQLQAHIPDLPPQAVPFVNDATEQMRAGRAADALRPMLVVTNFLRVTGVYQAGVMALEGPGGALIGFPVVTMSEAFAEAPSQEDVLASLSFTDATGAAGLDVAVDPGTATHIAASDYDGDGDDDLFVTSAAGSRLLRNDLGTFTDITADAGARVTGGVAAIFADYDNDGYLDLFISRDGPDALLRHQGDGTFVDVSRDAGIRAGPASDTPLFLDADHDGDLDLFLPGTDANRLYRNNGDGTFVEMAARMGLGGHPGAQPGAAFGDIDGDAGLDLIVANRSAGPLHYRNLLEGRFEEVTAATGLDAGTGAGAVAIGDYNNDGSLDLFAGGEGTSVLFTNLGDGRFAPDERPTAMLGALQGHMVRQAEFLDFDNDGWLDLLVVSDGSDIQLFRNGAPGRFDNVSTLLPSDMGAVRSVAVVDFGQDGDLDVVVAPAAGGLRLLRNDGGDANRFLKLQLTGLAVAGSKNNRFGIGAQVEIRAGGMYQMRVVTQPTTHFGLGQRTQADVLRIVWTNGVPQNVFAPPSNQDLVEEQILKGSCPFLYAWNGERYEFVTDVMWRSALGMPLDIMGGAGMGYAPAASSREYIRIPGAALKPKAGKYSMQVTGELWETGYLDEIKLAIVDHPDSVAIVLDERFVPPGDATLRIYQVADPRTPVGATDDKGRDLLPLLRAQDDAYVSQFGLGKFQGVTEMHDLVLDLGEVDPGADVTLFLNGWIFPTDASINVAMAQSDRFASQPPQVQVIGPRGDWVTVIDNMSFPSGKAKTVVVDLAGKFPTADRRVRIRTNMQIYWDHVYFATGDLRGPTPQAMLTPTAADLHYRGFSRMYRKGGRYGPFWFDYSEVSTEPAWLPLEGRFTRYGDVLPLLTDADDMYAVFGPGDEITIAFDTDDAPVLPAGWQRTFLLYSDSWLKDADLNTATGQSVEPLPFHGMTGYPYGSNEAYPTSAAHQQYLREYNTRN